MSEELQLISKEFRLVRKQIMQHFANDEGIIKCIDKSFVKSFLLYFSLYKKVIHV